MTRILSAIIIFMVAALPLWGTVEDARALYNQGSYAEAIDHLAPILKKSPRDGSANYWMGASLMALDRSQEALPYLTTAEGRGVADASLALARLSTARYDVDEARDHYDRYTAAMRKARRTVPDEVDAEISRLVMIENMLDRVERIVVIDSISVPREAFFSHYRLSPEAGRLVPGATARIAGAEVAFMPQDQTQIIFALPDSVGVRTLMSADILDDGSIDTPAPLPGEPLSDGADADFPFLLSDGLTLYFAAQGDASIGGYDIFLTRRTDDGYLQPQNMGLPYNSPYDDYMLAIDETTGAGWWATDRNRLPGMVTIYTFIPNETRVNVDPDDEDLLDLATLADYRLTQTASAPVAEVLARIDALGHASEAPEVAKTADFHIVIGKTGRIYTSLSDFRSPQARKAMTQAIDARARLAKAEESLLELRQALHEGRRADSSRILALEDEAADARRQWQASVNKAITIESKSLK